MKTIDGADLFCGAGGTSTGFLKAMKKLGYEHTLIAVNHWATAIETHKLNHPQVKHVNSDLEKVNPLDLVPSGYLDFLWASPECTYYSNALGGKPVNNQSRATPKWVLKWLSVLNVKKFSMENVPEFRNWGPLHRTCTCGLGVEVDANQHKKCHFQKPIKKRQGEYFRRFIQKLESLGYAVQYRVLCAADYGVPTTRRRLFIVGSLDGKIVWPEPTHHKTGGAGDMFAPKKKWKTARDHVIDWSIQGESIFNREARGLKPLSPKTMKRIWEGFWKFNGKAFMMSNQAGALPYDVDERPVPTLTANGHIRLFEPYITTLDMGGSVREVDKPLHTLTSAEATSLVQPFLVSLEQLGGNGKGVRSVDSPTWTVTGSAAMAVAEPFILPYNTEHEGQKIRARSTDLPLTTVQGSRTHALAQPFLVSLDGTSESAIKGSSYPIQSPVPTVRGNGHFGVAEPYFTEYYGTGGAHSVDETLPTVTGNDRFGLVMPIVQDIHGKLYVVDIRYRMFKKKEYCRAQGIPKNYKFKGGSKAVMKQIGNAVPPEFAYQITYANMKGVM